MSSQSSLLSFLTGKGGRSSTPVSGMAKYQVLSAESVESSAESYLKDLFAERAALTDELDRCVLSLTGYKLRLA